MPRPAGLSDQEKAFCQHYVRMGNATQAAIKAGYTKRSANVAGSRLLARPRVREYIAELQSKAKEAVNTLIAKSLKATDSRLPTLPPIGTPVDMREDIDAEVAAILSRAYINAALIENLETCLGRRKVTIIKVAKGKKGEPPTTVELQITNYDPGSANTAAALLQRELDRQERFPATPEPDDPTLIEASQTAPGKWDTLAAMYGMPRPEPTKAQKKAAGRR